jgi:hypothetical protein
VYVSFSTIPSRVAKIAKILDQLQKQTQIPDKIIVNIPDQYIRFKDQPIDYAELERLQTLYPNFVVNRISTDWGPLTKFLPTVEFCCVTTPPTPPTTPPTPTPTTSPTPSPTPPPLIITIDDDIIYPRHLIEKLVAAFLQEGGRCAIGLSGLMLNSIDLSAVRSKTNNKKYHTLEGFGGVIYDSQWFSPSTSFLNYCQQAIQDPSCFRTDDLVIHNYLAKEHIDRKVVNDPANLSIRHIIIPKGDDSGLNQYGTLATAQQAAKYLKSQGLFYLL